MRMIFPNFKNRGGKMGFFETIGTWHTERQNKHLAYMKAKGKCPDCNGSRIVHTYSAFFTAPPICPGCNGTGSYSDWASAD